MNRRQFMYSGGACLLGSASLGDAALAEAAAPAPVAAAECTDCTDWLAARLKSRAGVVRLPAGDFRISRPLDIGGAAVVGAGPDLTRLVYTGPADGACLSVGCSPAASAEVRDLSVIRAGREGGTAIAVQSAGACYFDHRRRILIDNVVFRGSEVVRGPAGWVSSPSWQTCIELGDAWGTYLDRIDAIGGYDIRKPPDGQRDRSVFLRTGAASGILSARVAAVTAASFHRAVEIGPRTFFFISDSDFAACYDGIASIHGSGDGFSEGRIRDSLINAQHIGIQLKNSSWREIAGVAVNRHKEGYKQGDWTGMQLDGVAKSWIGRMRFQVDTSRGEFPGKAVGIVLNRCSDLIVSEVMFGTGLACDIVQTDCARILTANNVNHAPLSCRRPAAAS